MAGQHRAKANGHRYREAKKRFIKQAEPVCAICHQPIEKTLRFPAPGSPSVDHIIPLALGGHATDRSNWQLACLRCNRWKSDRLVDPAEAYSTITGDPCASIHHWSRVHYGEPERCPNGRALHAVPWTG